MSKRLKYTAPAILEDLALELEAEILGASADLQVDENFEKVESMGQEVGGAVAADQWAQHWE